VGTSEFLRRVGVEIARAKEAFPDQEDSLSAADWLAVLVEEVGEVARELNELMLGNQLLKETGLRLEQELVQTAAMAGRFYRSIARWKETA
jgi:NTP pyrophosphatase (non-canonical NTP hydrolase)